MKLDIVQVGEPVLRARARSLTIEEIGSREIQQLIADMRETMYAAPGVGLAAPQIGRALALAVIEDRSEYQQDVPPERLAERGRREIPFQVIINPRIVPNGDGDVDFFEGCLSVAGFVALVPRSLSVRVECLDERAEAMTIEARGWYARILQHEIDHLHGTLCIDRMLPRSFMTAANHARHWADKPIAEVRSTLRIV